LQAKISDVPNLEDLVFAGQQKKLNRQQKTKRSGKSAFKFLSSVLSWRGWRKAKISFLGSERDEFKTMQDQFKGMLKLFGN
jgi:hypothetical protein